jgi:alpha-glucoside transport system permease protein
MPRDVAEAARTVGGYEWQVFRGVTVPLLWPVLTVVLVTMVINVLKVFDIVLSLAPESVQAHANVIALAMWRTSFGRVNEFGTGAAIAVFRFLLVIPAIALSIKRFRRRPVMAATPLQRQASSSSQIRAMRSLRASCARWPRRR